MFKIAEHQVTRLSFAYRWYVLTFLCIVNVVAIIGTELNRNHMHHENQIEIVVIYIFQLIVTILWNSY